MTTDSAARRDAAAETERVRRAYARRPARDERYSWLQPAHQYLMQQRDRAVLAALRRHGLLALEGLRVLEIGCGDGNWLRDLVRWGASPERLAGVDLLRDRLREAARKGPPGSGLALALGNELPFSDATFDLVIQSTVFTSILDGGLRARVAVEMLRVLRPGGHVLWYDFHVNNPRNPDVRAVGRAELRALFPGCDVDARRVTLAPPLARRIAGWSWLACRLLEAVPLLRTHSLAVISRRVRP
ncbi:MAG TPA: class I SAM-dependent methyltransferase [Gemmatimonadales bacterium]|nr:class I SAM-dependent methyltransferase [Gemmatimonadales bacterium]